MIIRLFFTAVVLVTTSGIGFAGDLPPGPPIYRLPPVVAPPPIYSWNGFYIGANGGFGWSQESVAFTFTGGALDGLGGARSATLNNANAGVQFGFNYQSGTALLGVEFDAQWSGQQSQIGLCSGPVCVFDKLKIQGFATARGRVGVVGDRWTLLYATGGAAWVATSNEVSMTAFGATSDRLTVFADKIGWTIGLGTEIAANSDFSVKFEYLYLAFDGLERTRTVPVALGGGSLTENGTIRNHILRLGVNYRFFNLFADRYPIIARY